MRKMGGNTVQRARRLRFERVVRTALNALPPDILDHLDNVLIVIEEEPTADQLDARDADPDSLFGLYEGTPLIDRTSAYTMTVPDKITIFQGPIERSCRSRQEMEREIRTTVWHELAHHLGFDEEQVESLGLA